MDFNTREYATMLGEKSISVIYSGPIWAAGIDGIAEMLSKRLEVEEMDESLSQSVFSVFVEQMNNMQRYFYLGCERFGIFCPNGQCR